MSEEFSEQFERSFAQIRRDFRIMQENREYFQRLHTRENALIDEGYIEPWKLPQDVPFETYERERNEHLMRDPQYAEIKRELDNNTARLRKEL